MKFVHLSDLHIGKRVNEFSMIEDQIHIFADLIDIIRDEAPDAVIIAGDVYDKAVPSAEAVQLFDDLLFSLSQLGVEVFIISGNHDSPERIAFGARLMDKGGIHMSPVFNGTVEPFTVEDNCGKVNIYMLPFVKPGNVRRYFPDEEIESYTDAVRVAVGAMNVNTQERNILVTHQFVTGAVTSESEEISVGGSDNVDASVFEPFDYVALGHIHGPQHIDRDTVRYCGTLLKYSFSEASHNKSVTVVEMGEKGSIDIKKIPVTPLHDMREIRGTFAEITSKENYANTRTDDYIRVTLTDEEDIPDAISKLRLIYPNIMRLDYDNKRTRATAQLDEAVDLNSKSPLLLFCEFYEAQNGQPMSEEQLEFCKSLMEKIWEGER